MSGANSLDLAREVRQQSHVPIMFLTNGAYSVPLPSLHAYADDHVVWPYEPENLLAQVQALVYRSEEVTTPSSNVVH
jgi:DNA-binding response OmpR family regulator